jgi:hypothetical protein
LSGNTWWRLAWVLAGNAAVTPVTPRRAHRPAACRDRDCQRPLCVTWRDAYDDGWEDGYSAGAQDAKEET